VRGEDNLGFESFISGCFSAVPDSVLDFCDKLFCKPMPSCSSCDVSREVHTWITWISDGWKSTFEWVLWSY